MSIALTNDVEAFDEDQVRAGVRKADDYIAGAELLYQ